jgi:hypothetical protein
MGGPWIKAPLEPEVVDTIFSAFERDNIWPVHPDPAQHVRRSIYLHRKRNVKLPLLAVFDQPDLMTPCGGREESVHALQSLVLVNSDFMAARSRDLAERLLREEPRDETRRVTRLFHSTLGRPPVPMERTAALRLVKDQTAARLARREPGIPASSGTQPEEVAAWADLCLGVFNLNEFIYVR